MGMNFVDLPVEIHEKILDQLIGEKPPISQYPEKPSALHHARQSLSNLALVCRSLSLLVQRRIYRHVKVEGSRVSMKECIDWFMKYPDLRDHVHHIEIWLPVWGNQVPCSSDPIITRRAIQDSRIDGVSIPSAGYRYHQADDNAAMDEIFSFVKSFFASARILTLDGGYSVSACLVRLFRNHATSRPSGQNKLPKLDRIETLVMRNAWNLLQNYDYWFHINYALPNLREWHCSYAQVQKQAYVTVAGILAAGRNTIRHINLNLEEFPHVSDNVYSGIPKPILEPVCRALGKAAIKIETLSFTGRVCGDLFCSMRDEALKLEDVSRLRSVDLQVKACCLNDLSEPRLNVKLPICHALSGINNMHFNNTFHAMILEAIRTLAVFPNLKHVRIRYIDLDWRSFLQNHYFELKDNKCTGLRSDAILDALHESRPEASFVELNKLNKKWYRTDH